MSQNTLKKKNYLNRCLKLPKRLFRNQIKYFTNINFTFCYRFLRIYGIFELYQYYFLGGILMKKNLLGLLVLALFFISGATSVYAAQGNWTSTWQWDANGVSGVGTSNAQNETGHYSLRVVRGGGAWIGNQNAVLGPNQSSSAQFWGQALLDRQGQVLIAPRFYHAPWFNA